MRSGKSVRAAISAGYAKGFHTIIDANVVTVITALVLFAVATAQVKGFALMLLIGTVDLAGHRRRGDARDARPARRLPLVREPALHGRAAASRAGSWLQIDFMRKRRTSGSRSPARSSRSRSARSRVKGLNLGIDFKGGTQVTFKTPQPTSLGDGAHRDEQVDRPGERGRPGPRQRRPAATSTRASSCALKSLNPAQQDKLRERRWSTKLGATTIGIQTVSASFGRQIARSAIIAILVSLLLIVLYIAIRFDFKFAVPVIVALLHDIVITVGVYSLTGREVTNATVAAVLTVLGYSIYDTIIIFDRIRENIPLMRRAPFATIANVSLWETIRRSLATTFITLLPIVVAAALRRRDAEGLRVRADRRHRLRCLLVDLHRRAAADDLEGARAGVRAPQGQRARGRRRRRRLAAREAAAAEAGAAKRSTAGRSRRRPSVAAASAPPSASVTSRLESRRRSASGGGSGGARGRMAAPAEHRPRGRREARAGRRRRRRADGRAGRTRWPTSSRRAAGCGRDEARSLIEELVGRWRSESVRLGERAGAGLAGVFRELGLVTRDEFEELELRVAQLEHRLRLARSRARV